MSDHYDDTETTDIFTFIMANVIIYGSIAWTIWSIIDWLF